MVPVIQGWTKILNLKKSRTKANSVNIVACLQNLYLLKCYILVSSNNDWWQSKSITGFLLGYINFFCLQSRRCVDAGKQAISGVWVFVHGFEALYGHYSKRTVYGQNACQGLYPIFIFLESLGVKGNIKINQW